MPRCLLAYEPPDGGVAENVRRLAIGLPDHGWEVWVVGPRESVTYPTLTALGTPTARLTLARGYGRPLRDANALAALLRIIRRERFDLVHAHSAKAGVLARAAAGARGTATVYTPHCFPFVGPWKPPRRLFSIAMERALGRDTDAIICVAEQERELALAHRIGDPERLRVVHNGSEPCAEGSAPHETLRAFRGDGVLAACMTVLRPQKAVHTFIDAAPSVLERVPAARLAVIGNGDLRSELERRAERLGLGERFRFFDFEPPGSDQLRALDTFVLPSAWEAFPISILEAMACGVPQVATDVGGTAEALDAGTTGLLCPPGEPAALADAITALLEDPSRRERMAAASRERHARLFGVDRMVAETAAVYDWVVSSR